MRDGLNEAKAIRAPGDNKAGVAQFAFAQKNSARGRVHVKLNKLLPQSAGWRTRLRFAGAITLCTYANPQNRLAPSLGRGTWL